MVKKNKVATVALSASALLLSQIVAFGEAGGYVAPSPELESLKAAGHVEQGPNGENGTVAVRATAAGTEAAKAAPVADASAPAAEKPKFAVVMNVPLPESTRGGNKGKSIYPFDEMVVGASFFIAATAETPDPAKSLTSTATSATRRYDEPVLENGQPVYEDVAAKPAKGVEGQDGYKPAVPAGRRQKMRHTRVFVMRAIADGAPWGFPGVAGAGVFRTQ